ncbi:hypothetical protein BVY04_00430 [bacterium M21]|nr:hypothetical protein BVY04_00430 [bacterium M21]
MQNSYDHYFAPHCKWWSSFWSKSDIQVPDHQVQNYYNLMQYYYGAASREGAPPMPLQGVWTADNGKLPPWHGDYHFDMNVQMCYWAYMNSGRFESGKCLLDFMWNLRATHRAFAKEFFGTTKGIVVPGVMALDGRPMGGWGQYSLSPVNGIWLAQHFYWHWLYTMDSEFLKTRAFPYCQEIAEAFEDILVTDKDGMLKLPLSSSPEIHDQSMRAWLTPNSNNDLALFIWLYDKMQEMAKEVGDEEAVKKYAALRQKLDPLAVDETGLKLSPDEPLNESHRHHSHLMAIQPLATMTIEDAAEKKIIEDSLAHLKKLGTKRWVGFSWPWAACLEARSGDGEDTYKYLVDYINRTTPNGFNPNGNKKGPFTLDANFGASQAVHAMLLQSWGDKLRLFKATPEKWQDVSFRDLRAERGFIISATRKGGKTSWAKITSITGRPCKVLTDFAGKIELKAPAGVTVENKDGLIVVHNLLQGQTIELLSK